MKQVTDLPMVTEVKFSCPRLLSVSVLAKRSLPAHGAYDALTQSLYPHLSSEVTLISQGGGTTAHRSSTKDAVTAKYRVSSANHLTVTAADRSSAASSLQMSKPKFKPWLPGC